MVTALVTPPATARDWDTFVSGIDPSSARERKVLAYLEFVRERLLNFRRPRVLLAFAVGKAVDGKHRKRQPPWYEDGYLEFIVVTDSEEWWPAYEKLAEKALAPAVAQFNWMFMYDAWSVGRYERELAADSPNVRKLLHSVLLVNRLAETSDH